MTRPDPPRGLEVDEPRSSGLEESAFQVFLEAATGSGGDAELDATVERVAALLFGGTPPAPETRWIGRFEDRGEISYGGMGVVHRAFDPMLRRVVAIKLRRPDRPERPGDYERLLNEARALGALDHENVISVHEAGRLDERRLYVVLEYVDGVTLARWLGEARPWTATLEVFRQIGVGLAAAHARQLVHRDVKPANILIRRDGRVKLIDFGLARVLGEEPAPAAEDTPGAAPELYAVTEHGNVLGTRGFIAPELFFGAAPSPASDVFSYCVTLYWALFRRLPFEEGLPGPRPSRAPTQAREDGPSLPPASDLAVVLGQYVEPHSGEAGVPRHIAALLRRGLAADPARRYPSMQALLADLTRRPYLRPTLALGVVLVALAGLGFALRPAAATPEPCASVADELADVWNPARKQQVTRAFLAADRPEAASIAEAVTDQLDGHAEAWLAARRRVCRATIDRLTPEVEAQRECLARGEQSLRVAASALVDVDAAGLRSAPEQLAALPWPSACLEAPVLAAECREQPRDEDLKPRVKKVERALDVARAAALRGDFTAALAASSDAVDMSDRTGLEGLQAATRIAHGDHLYAAGRAESARAALLDAADRAEQRGCSDVIADAYSRLNKLAALSGTIPRPVAEERARIQMNQAQHLGPAQRRLADAFNDRGLVRMNLSHQSDEAEVDFREAIRIRAALPEEPAQLLALAESHLNLASAIYGAGGPARRPEVRAELETSIELRARAVGADHPSMYKAYLNLGNRQYEAQELEDARRSYDRAFELAEGYGAHSREAAHVHIALARLAGVEGDTDAALRHARAAAASAVDPDALQLDALEGLAVVFRVHGELAESERLLRRVLAMHEASDWIDPRVRARTLASLAETLYSREDPVESARLASLAILDLRAAPEPHDISLALASLALGDALLYTVDDPRELPADQAARAHEAYHTAIEIWSSRDDDPELLAHARWGLARVLCHARGEPLAGRAAAELSLAYFESKSPKHDGAREMQDRVSAWLREGCRAPRTPRR